MSDHSGIDVTTRRPLPVSAGTSPWVKFLLVGGVVLAIAQGSFVVRVALFGRIFPAADSATVKLPPFQPSSR